MLKLSNKYKNVELKDKTYLLNYIFFGQIKKITTKSSYQLYEKYTHINLDDKEMLKNKE